MAWLQKYVAESNNLTPSDDITAMEKTIGSHLVMTSRQSKWRKSFTSHRVKTVSIEIIIVYKNQTISLN